MTDELRCFSEGFNGRVHTHEKYDVNGYRFHTEFHQKNRPNAKTINTGVYTGGADATDYYGMLEKVYELKFNRMNIELKLVIRSKKKARCIPVRLVRPTHWTTRWTEK